VPVIVERTMNEGWLSNTYLVADEPGGHGLLIDSGGPIEPVLRKIEALRLSLTHLLCTHHHLDHVQHNAAFQSRFGLPICGHRLERELFGALDLELEDGDEIRSGSLRVRALHVPGHTLGQLAFVVDEKRVFTGDTLFRRTVGGTRAPGHTSFDELRNSIMQKLMRLPREMPVHPGHSESTTIGEEWEQNPFIRIWRGADAPGDEPCRAAGRPATLLLRAPDYDGGTKCWVRFDEDGRMDVVGGSQVGPAGD
jgi:glyoxylase-like metal-dependent hydrolase (beta-lactamase superfamily II)